MDLELVLNQAGRHFADSLAPSVMPGSGSRRQKATELAWYLLAMLAPDVVDVPGSRPKGSKVPAPPEPRLVVVKPGDQDIQRLASEIFGVGAGLELLRRLKVVDGRTFNKLSDRFDFEANERNGGGKVRIEVKGTADWRSASAQRRSIKKKLATSGAGYVRSIGIVTSLRTNPSAKTWDAEVVDPPGSAENDRDGALRAAIRHYARLYDNDIQLERAATYLWDLAAQALPIEQLPDLTDWLSYLPQSSRSERRFSRASFILSLGDQSFEFWGGYWQSRGIGPPMQAKVGHLPVGYIGVDAQIITMLRGRAFDEFLDFKGLTGMFAFEGEDVVDATRPAAPIEGVLVADADGSVRAWLSAIPQGTIRA